METSTIEIVMKGVTFLGVALAAALVASRHVSVRALLRDAALGAGGIVLMFANARLGAAPLGLAVDVTYLGVCAARLAHHARASQRTRRAAQDTSTDVPSTSAH